ncbi:MAG TPA: GNAT family N-acetyltransferase [Vicinamibacterales bacterium]|nr:GNAT family N-acetyltransferase [Vicinamibacterales bacterium]
MTTDVIEDYAAFVALEDEWNDAVERASVPHPFLRHEWVRTWWDSFQGNRELHIIVVRDADRIIGIAPLMREAATVYGLPIRRLALLANDHTPRTDFLVSGNADEVYRAVWNALRDDIDHWDVVQLTQLLKGSPTSVAMTRFAAAEGLPIGTWESSASPYLELSGTWDSYWASLPAKFRSNVRNRLSRLTQVGEPALEILSDKRAIARACDDAWRLEASGWKDQEGTSITSDPAVRTFYTLLAERGADCGWLRLVFLTVGGRRIAVSYSAVHDGRLFLLKTGHDREFHTCSPFKLLTYFAAQEGYARGLREIDFLGDTEPWKEEWTPAARPHDWLFVFSTSRRARLLHSIKFQMAPEIRKWRA